MRNDAITRHPTIALLNIKADLTSAKIFQKEPPALAFRQGGRAFHLLTDSGYNS